MLLLGTYDISDGDITRHNDDITMTCSFTKGSTATSCLVNIGNATNFTIIRQGRDQDVAMVTKPITIPNNTRWCMLAYHGNKPLSSDAAVCGVYVDGSVPVSPSATTSKA